MSAVTPTSIVLTSSDLTRLVSEKLFFTIQLKNGSFNAALPGVQITLTYSPAQFSNVLTTVTTDSTGRATGSFECNLMGVGTFTLRAASAFYSLFSNTLTAVISGTAPTPTNPFDAIVLTSADLSREVGQNWFCTAQLRKNGANAAVGGQTLQLLRNGIAVFFQVTDATGRAQMTVPVLSIGPAGVYTMQIQSDQYPLIKSNSVSLTITDPQTQYAVSLQADKLNMNSTDSLGLTIITNPPTPGVHFDIRLFNTAVNNQPMGLDLVTGPGGIATHMIPGTQLASGQNRMTAFEKSGGPESAEIIVVVASLPPTQKTVTWKRKADGSDITDANDIVQVGSTITAFLQGFTPGLATGIRWYDASQLGENEIGNIPIDSSGAAVADYVVGQENPFIGTHSMVVRDITVTPFYESIRIIDVRTGTPPPPPPPPPGGGIGKTWFEMSFTEKIFAVALGGAVGVAALKLSGLDKGVNFKYPKPEKRRISKGIDQRALRKWMRRAVR